MKKLLQKILVAGVIISAVGNHQTSHGQVIQIGTGVITSSVSPVSVGGSSIAGYRSSHHQVLYTAAQLAGQGVTGAKWLDSIAWQVAQVPAVAIKNYTIKGKLFSASSWSAFETLGFTQLVNFPTYTPGTTGFKWIVFTTPLYWNGTDNIMFDICSDSTATTLYSGKVYTSNTSTNSYWGYSNESYNSCGTTSPMTKASVTSGSGYAQPNIKMSFRAATGCLGVPASLTISPAGPLTNCINQTQILQISSTLNGPANIQWQRSDNGGAWADIASATGVSYTATYANNIAQTSFRAKIKCVNDSVMSNVVSLSPTFLPKFASLPYTQDFESWINECNVTDAPDSSWVNTNAMGSFSWRREDQGNSANWLANDYSPGGSNLPYYYYPLSSTGNHSARVQTSKGPGIGSLLLYVNCEGPNGGGKELRFDYYSRTTALTTFLNVYCSVDSGATFLLLGTMSNQGVTDSWTSQVLQIPSNSPKTVIKFEANSATGSSGDFDMGIDNVRVLQACNETPTVGTVDSTSACLGSGLVLGLTGSSSAAGLTWLWEQSVNGISWDTIPGGDVEHPSVALNGPTWYRCILSCSNTNGFAISAPRLITPNPFYLCYCFSTSTVPNPGVNIGNFKMRANAGGPNLIDNGNALPTFNNPACNKHHSDFTTVPAADLFLDSVYRVTLNFIDRMGPPNNPAMPTVTTKIYIDWNHDGSFDASEKAWVHTKNQGTTAIADSGLITVPSTAMTGTTAMRVIANGSVTDTTDNVWNACSSYSTGETEDYLVNVWAVPCSGGALAGTVSTSDTLSCPGYPFTLTNIGYDTTTGVINRIWQQSTDGSNYTDIVGSDNQSVLTQTFTVPMWYRVQSSCNAGGTPTTSNAIKVKKHVICYCTSYADGGFSGMQDSSDVGGFVFGGINDPLTGGHLNNADAIQKYTNHVEETPTEYWVDSTYNFNIDHIIERNDHMDAKVTMFIDYNANGTFDIPAERVYSDMSTIQSWQKTGNIIIPGNAVLNTPTGLRVIINNDTAANIPSDEACGTYTSGETEDYIVKFKKYTPPPPPTGVGSVEGLIQNIRIFPNPSTGIVMLDYTGEPLNGVTIKVQNVTGVVLNSYEIGNMKTGEKVQVDLNQYAKGIYFISLESEGNKATAKVVLQ